MPFSAESDTPRDHEEHALVGPQDDASVGLEAVARHNQVHALGCSDSELTATADELLQLVGPDPGGIDHLPRPDFDFIARLQVSHPDAGKPLAVPQEVHHPGATGHDGPV
jgi:hypothetical protein